jgi:hypothetical protein
MNTNQELIASRKRAAHPEFVSTFGLDALQDHLPLRFPVPAGVRACVKRRYRSQYRYLGYADLSDPDPLADLSLFEVALRLIDFSSLRAYLAGAYYAGGARGQVPFDPVSLFLCVCLRRELGLGWRRLAKLLAGEHGPGWRRRFGLREGDTPSPSGLRYFFHTVGPEVFEELCPLFIDTLRQVNLLPERSTFPGDPPERGVSICHDIMLHEAQTRMRCGQVSDTCYQPAPRPCPAQAEGWEGCDCTDPLCAQVCRWTTPQDQEARLIHYAGRNKYADLPTPTPTRSRNVYGYASNPDRLLDDRFACAWTLRTGLHPANSDPQGYQFASAICFRVALPACGRAFPRSRSARCWPMPPWASRTAWTPSGKLAPCAWWTSAPPKGMTTASANCNVATTRTAMPCVSTATPCVPTATTTAAGAPSGSATRSA